MRAGSGPSPSTAPSPVTASAAVPSSSVASASLASATTSISVSASDSTANASASSALDHPRGQPLPWAPRQAPLPAAQVPVAARPRPKLRPAHLALGPIVGLGRIASLSLPGFRFPFSGRVYLASDSRAARTNRHPVRLRQAQTVPSAPPVQRMPPALAARPPEAHRIPWHRAHLANRTSNQAGRAHPSGHGADGPACLPGDPDRRDAVRAQAQRSWPRPA